MDQLESEKIKNTKKTKENSAAKKNLLSKSEAALAAKLAGDWIALEQKKDGHWCAELESNATITAEYVFLYQALGIDLSQRRKDIVKYFLSQQKKDGSWGIAYDFAGDVSTTLEVYFAMKLLGEDIDAEPMIQARKYIRAQGGAEKMRIFTRINLASFGLFPWNSIPVIPAEFIYMPSESPINIYKLSSWARTTMVPLFIIFSHKPKFSLPVNDGTFLDELWLNPHHKEIPYGESWFDVLKTEGLSYRTFFSAADQVLKITEKLRTQVNTQLKTNKFIQKTKALGSLYLGGFTKNFELSLRQTAVKECERWILERQEKAGDWAGIFPPMVNGVMALYLNGHGLESDPVKRGLEAIEKFALHDEEGFRMQACVSPVWDTVLVMRGILDCESEISKERMLEARQWVTDKQIKEEYGDWKVYNPNGTPGGWSFEYENTWYPDIDDTAAVMLAFLKQEPKSSKTEVLQRAAQWIVSMQNSDGGWAAFDKDNNKLYLNKIPFSDMDSLCDPSSPDVTGRVLEAFGVLKDSRYKYSIDRGIEYLKNSQEPEGSWYGRWGVNYVYGTSNVLCGLSELDFSKNDLMVDRALKWLKSKQNKDGGWGECLESYADRTLMGIGTSTASQTAWAVMGLLAFLPASDSVIQTGIQWLVNHQIKEGALKGTWEEKEFTGTGFPNHFYLRYHLYRHAFPMMAIGRFLKKAH